MKKINGIKLIFAALPVIVIVLLLFIRYYRSTQSYKSLANWGKGNMGFSEQAYYTNKVGNVITKWQKAGNNPDDTKESNSTFLNFDLAKNAVWLEENGEVKEENYINLPENIKWTLYYSASQTPLTLPQKTILKTLGHNQMLSGNYFFLSGNWNHSPYRLEFNTQNFRSGYSSGPLWSGFSIQQPGVPQQTIDCNLLIVSEEEYKKDKDSLAQRNSGQSNEKENAQIKAIEDNKSRWLEAAKYLYMEIEGQVQNAGYELSYIEVEAGPDYTGAYALIQGHGESVIHKYLDLGGGSKTVQAYLKFDYIGNDIWYAKTAPHPKQKLESDRKLNLEFLIFPDEQIPRRQYKKYIKQGRNLQRTERFLSSKWKAALPNGVVVEIIGIRAAGDEGDKWWGPDGSKLNSDDFFTIEPMKKEDSNFEIVWNIKWPQKKEGKQVFFVPEGAKDHRSVDVRDRHGNTQSVMISVFDNSLQKTSFRIGIQETEEISRYAGFKNISFIPGVDQGFEIESDEK